MTDNKADSFSVGVIGLGSMGLPMARNLHKAGQLTAVFNRTVARAQQFATGQAVIAVDTPVTLAAMCNVIILCVPNDEDVLNLIDDMLPGLQAGSVVIDMSTVSSATAYVAAEKLATVTCSFLDAPVSGGTEGARLGNLSIMVGGDAAVLERVRPVLECLGERVVLMGVVGSGQATKAVNQLMAAGINQAVSEALAFAEAMHLDMDKLIDVLAGGAAGNWFLTHRGHSMVSGQYPPGFKLALHLKDLEICRKMVAELGEGAGNEDVRLPLVEMTRIHYQRLLDAGYGDEDISVLFRLKQELFHQT